jgi:hypothetical protein
MHTTSMSQGPAVHQLRLVMYEMIAQLDLSRLRQPALRAKLLR